jgi:hypothetical protein
MFFHIISFLEKKKKIGYFHNKNIDISLCLIFGTFLYPIYFLTKLLGNIMVDDNHLFPLLLLPFSFD